MNTNANYSEKKQYNDNHDLRVWRDKKNIQSDGIFPKINHNLFTIKTLTNALLEEKKKEKVLNKKKVNISRNLKRNHSTSVLYEKDISPHTKKIISKVGKLMKQMKNTTNEISKMNELYLDKNETDNLCINTTKNNMNENKLVKNFSYINDKYRKQLNNAFLRFNPISYMQNLKILEKSEPVIKKDLEDLKKSIDEEIKEITDKHRIQKKYNKLIERNRMKEFIKCKSAENLFHIGNTDSSVAKNTTSKISNFNDNNNKFSITRKSMYSKKKFSLDNKIEEMEKMIECANSIDKFIDKKNIKNNIDKSLSNYAMDNYFHFYNEHERIKPKNFFEKQRKGIVKQLFDIKIFKIDQRIDNERRGIYNQIENIKNIHLNKVNHISELLKKEMNSNLDKFKINLEKV